MVDLNLLAGLKGQVLTPSEAGYTAASQPWNLAVQQKPALIVIAENPNDVVLAVRYAQSKKMSVALMATGHGVVREANDSLLIVTSQMTEVRVDAQAQTAWVGAGAKWGQVLAAAQAAGLAPLLGSSPDVGAVGYTLGGGLGWLARKYGLATDSVNYFEVVTAQGERVVASAAENAELFWALRGGGGNFGVVVGMEIRLYPITNVYGGNLYYPPTLAREVFARYREWSATAPEELTSSVVVMNFPPFPAVPDFLRGQSFAVVRGCYTGSVAHGEALLKFWREWQPPLMDDFKFMPFAQVATISNDPLEPLPGWASGAWLRDLSVEAAETIIRYALPQQGPPPLIFAEVRHVGGAMARVDPASAAFSHRSNQYILSVVGAAPTPQIHTALRGHMAQLKQELQAQLTGGVYMNFLEGAEARERTRQGYSPENYQRLHLLKLKYDPQNLFSHSYDFSSP